jgi:hypothetical protein
VSDKVFYSIVLSDFVVDAVCECGHLERDHGSQIKPFGLKKIRIHDGGSCCAGKCQCQQFRWLRWMTATEFANNLPLKQEERLAVI